MQRLYKYLIFIFVLVFGSCVNELETGSDKEAAAEGSFSLEVSVSDPTRTALGTPTSTAFPTVWSEGDVISVNGLVSYPVPASSAGKSTAKFSFDGFPMLPLNLLYPATQELSSVEFPQTQTYVKGSFDPLAAPMYATSSGFENVSLSHLSSILRFSFTSSESAVVKYILVNSESKEPLAGTYTMKTDASGAFTGEIEAGAGALSMVILDCGEGVALSSEPTTFHVAVPYGTYSGFRIQLIASDGGIMSLNYKPAAAGELKPSKIVVFPGREYVSGGTAKLIGNEQDLLDFAQSAAEYTTAILLNDLTVTSGEFASIKDFTGTFEGGNNTISGLKTPLFDNLTGNVSNLNVSGNLVDDGAAPVGLLARTCADGEIVNCHSAGSVMVSAEAALAEEVAVGGLVGRMDLCSMSSCTNSASVDVKVLENVEVKLYCGGCVGLAFHQTAAEDSSMSFTNVVNNGTVTVDGVLKSGSGERDRSMVAGIVGKAYMKGTAVKGIITMSGCVNAADLTLKNSAGSERTYMGGLVGDAMCSDFAMTSCSNSGNITAEGPGKYICLAGHVGIMMRESETRVRIEDAVNTGNISLNEDLSQTESGTPSSPCFAGGIIGMANGPGSMLNLDVVNCSNSGNIHRMITNMDAVNTNKEDFAFAGGIVGSIGNTHKVDNDDYVTAMIDKCMNSGEIIFNQYTGEGDYKEGYYYCSFTGGIVGLSRAMHGSVDVRYCTNSGSLLSTAGTHGGIVGFAQSSTAIYGDAGNYCRNTATLGMRDVNNNSEKSSGLLVMGGICGYLKGDKDNVPSRIEYCWNDAVVAGSAKGAPGAGGIVAWTTVSDLVKYCKSSGRVRCMNGKDWESGTKGQASGLISGSKSDKPVSNCAAGGYIARNGGAWVTMTPAGGEKPFHNFVYTNAITADAAAEAGIEYWDGVSKTSWEE